MTKLPQRPLGATGLHVSVLGLGTVKWGRNQQVKYPAFELPDDATLHRLLDVAVEGGINFLDTAPAYGLSEERIGKILSQRPPDDSGFLIATKTGEIFSDGQSRHDFSAAATSASVERSLRLLGRERLDVVMVHCSADDLHVLDHTPVLETLERLKERGVIRATGVSTMTVAGGLRAAELADVVMVPFSAGYRDHLPVIEKAHTGNKGVLVKRGLYSGPSAANRMPLRDHLQPVLGCPGVGALVAGTINPLHLRENIAAACEVLDFPTGRR
jgi:aryl-alcohol dehydrogenase-like predicted oxidoreductase